MFNSVFSIKQKRALPKIAAYHRAAGEPNYLTRDAAMTARGALGGRIGGVCFLPTPRPPLQFCQLVFFDGTIMLLPRAALAARRRRCVIGAIGYNARAVLRRITGIAAAAE